MLCYKDKTFCPFYTECIKGQECNSALTERIRKQSKACGLPICSYKDKPECFKDKNV